MKFFITAKPNAKNPEIEKFSDNTFLIKVKEPAKNNLANQAVLKSLAGYLKVPVSNLKIISGRTSRKKIIQLV
ncbi:MAG: DUF167 domain-containing protein [Patescibacteria group bacterium]